MDEKFASELETELFHCRRWARRNYVFAHVVFALSVVSSFISTVLVSGDQWQKVFGNLNYRVITSLFASMPAVMLLVNNTLRFEERTKWFWRKARAVQRFWRELRDNPSVDIPALSKQFSELSESMEDEWPGFGAMPEQAVKETKSSTVDVKRINPRRREKKD
jgi:hypothetical protein